MKFGLQVSVFNAEGGNAAIGPRFLELAQRADEAGLDSFWVMDHYFQIPEVGPATDPMLEGYSALSAAAAVTRRISVGTLVSGVTYRHPGILVKTVTTLDVLSGGRAVLGLGAGWYEREHRALGVPFPSVAERFERLEETLQIANLMWSENDGPYVGKHYQLKETLCQPRPLSRSRPPILIGGGGERKTLRLAAQYADAWNMFSMNPAEVAPKLEVLRRHCEAVGRDFDAIEKSVLGPPIMPPGRTGPWGMTPEQGIAFLRRLQAMGIDHYIAFTSVDNAEIVDVLTQEIAPRFQE